MRKHARIKTVSAVVANRQFPALLRAVADGTRVTVTLRGRPVAVIKPVPEVPDFRRAGMLILLKRLAAQPAAGCSNWTRDSLYD